MQIQLWSYRQVLWHLNVMYNVHLLLRKTIVGIGHMVRIKLYWDASSTVGLSKQRNLNLNFIFI